MTTVTVYRRERDVQGLSVRGHAGYAEKGQDLVCAAASTLVTTCVNALEAVAGIAPKVIQDEDGAEISLRLPHGLPEPQAHDAQVILKTVLQGFQDIAQTYPHNLKINDGRTSSC